MRQHPLTISTNYKKLAIDLLPKRPSGHGKSRPMAPRFKAYGMTVLLNLKLMSFEFP